MISDTLFDAVAEIREYLDGPIYRWSAEDPSRQRVEALVREIEEVAQLLGMPPIDQRRLH